MLEYLSVLSIGLSFEGKNVTVVVVVVVAIVAVIVKVMS